MRVYGRLTLGMYTTKITCHVVDSTVDNDCSTCARMLVEVTSISMISNVQLSILFIQTLQI